MTWKAGPYIHIQNLECGGLSTSRWNSYIAEIDLPHGLGSLLQT